MELGTQTTIVVATHIFWVFMGGSDFHECDLIRIRIGVISGYMYTLDYLLSLLTDRGGRTRGVAGRRG